MRNRLLIAMATLSCSATPALAHAILVASTPVLGGAITAGHRTLNFRYNSRVDHKRSRLTLTGPDGKATVLPIAASSRSNALDAEADLVPGAYTLRWQALALDGHITRGDVPFTVTGPVGRR